ncbi:MAG: hypothetical protein ACE15D_14810 [Candidatus Eisenbacteria bacterium]|nr:hypothetical protein [Candidatus Eisenbacteria bacterium]
MLYPRRSTERACSPQCPCSPERACSPARFLAAQFSVLFSVLFAALLFASCAEDSPDVRPCEYYDVGAIAGQLRPGGLGAVFEVAAYHAPGTPSGPPSFSTRSDSTGSFHLELPSGVYQILIAEKIRSGTSDPPIHIDSLHVGLGIRTLHLDAGRLEIRLRDLPQSMHGSSIALVARQANVDPRLQYSERRNATIRGPELNVLFPILPAGRYRIEISLRSGPTLWMPGVSDPALADEVPVSNDEPAVYAVSYASAAQLRGTIHLPPEIADLAWPYLYAFDADSARVAELAVPPEEPFVVDLLTATPVRLLLDHRRTTRWVGGDSYEDATVFEPPPGGSIEGIDIYEAGIYCELQGPGDFSDDMNVRLIRADGEEIPIPLPLSSSPLVLANLAPGTYFLQLRHGCSQPWAPCWYADSPSLENATPIVITGEQELARIEMSLVAGGAISGTLIAGDCGSVGYRYLLLIEESGRSVCSRNADRAGAFVFQGLADGLYRISLEDCSTEWWYPGTADPDSAATIAIVDHSTHSGLLWPLSFRDAAARGTR